MGKHYRIYALVHCGNFREKRRKHAGPRRNGVRRAKWDRCETRSRKEHIAPLTLYCTFSEIFIFSRFDFQDLAICMAFWSYYWICTTHVRSDVKTWFVQKKIDFLWNFLRKWRCNQSPFSPSLLWFLSWLLIRRVAYKACHFREKDAFLRITPTRLFPLFCVTFWMSNEKTH